MFKCVRRESLDPKIYIYNPFSGAEESPRDVVLLVKAFMGSTELAQVPEVCFPLVGLKYLGEPPDSANLLPREPLSQRQSREFLRTADLVDKYHWKLDRAAETCKLWLPTMLAEALLLGQPR